MTSGAVIERHRYRRGTGDLVRIVESEGEVVDFEKKARRAERTFGEDLKPVDTVAAVEAVVDVANDGPATPETEVELLADGGEYPLAHGGGLGL